MAFTIEIKRKALRGIEGLEEKRKLAVKEIVMTLKDDPVPYRKADVSKLKGYDSVYVTSPAALNILRFPRPSGDFRFLCKT